MELLPYFIKQVEKKDQTKLLRSFSDLWEILLDAASDPRSGEIILVLDALDECEKSDKLTLIDKLKSFHAKISDSSGNLQKLKFLVTSRPELEIKRRFGWIATGFQELRIAGEENQLIEAEINTYIIIRVKEIARDLQLDDSERAWLEKQLLDVPNRTYLWASLILDQLENEDRITKRSLETLVGTLPRTLEEVYEQILSRGKDRDTARKILAFVVSAKQPLSLRELSVAIAIQSTSRSYRDLDIVPEHRFKDWVTSACGLFISVVKSRVLLIHQTAWKFLIQDDAADSPSSERWIHSLLLRETSRHVAAACMTYLMFDVYEAEQVQTNDGQSGTCIEDRIDCYTTEHSFLEYSANYWFDHLEDCDSASFVALSATALELVDTRTKRFRSWFSVYQDISRDDLRRLSLPDIMVAAFCGIPRLLTQLVGRGDDIGATDGQGQTMLQWIIAGIEQEHYRSTYSVLENTSERRLECLHLLLKKLADTAATQRLDKMHQVAQKLTAGDVDGFGGLDQEVRRSMLRDVAVPLLFEEIAGSETDLENGWTGNHLAAEACCEIIVSHVLNEMAEENAHETPTCSEILRDFLDDDADIASSSALEVDDDTANQQVTAAARQLLHKATQTKGNTGSKPTRLQQVADTGFELVIRFLLRVDRSGMLLYTVREGISSLVRLLLVNGADPNHVIKEEGSDDDWMYYPVIYFAQGQFRTARILLQYGAKPDLSLRSCCRSTGEVLLELTLLVISILSGPLELAQLLLEHGADPNRRIGPVTLLHSMVYHGKFSAAQLLLSNGADVNATITNASGFEGDFEGQLAALGGATALDLAEKQKHDAIRQLLLQHGAHHAVAKEVGMAVAADLLESAHVLESHDPSHDVNFTVSNPPYLGMVRGSVPSAEMRLVDNDEMNAKMLTSADDVQSSEAASEVASLRNPFEVGKVAQPGERSIHMADEIRRELLQNATPKPFFSRFLDILCWVWKYKDILRLGANVKRNIESRYTTVQVERISDDVFDRLFDERFGGEHGKTMDARAE
ncbi:hypothetical protein IL306_003957 [Fusarium sp. DS 682]|nr:hypothetical protein IL306_003957 [Fusarium sp. DS 682]